MSRPDVSLRKAARSASGSGRPDPLDSFGPSQLTIGYDDFSRSSARFSRRTLTRGSPMRPSAGRSIEASTSVAHLGLVEAARLGDGGDLREGVRRRDVGIEPGGRGGHGVGGNRPRAAIAPPGLDRALHPVDQLLRGRPEVRTGRIGGVVGRVDRLGRVVRVRVGRRRRTRVEIAVGLEVLPDQGRADDDAVLLDQAAVRLAREARAARCR